MKGEEFGFFAFGGSDMIMLFEAGKVEFTAKQNTHYNYGEQVAHAIL
jgi:phosphatidylserine decarboxylase